VFGGTGSQDTSNEQILGACGEGLRGSGRGTFEVEERKFLSVDSPAGAERRLAFSGQASRNGRMNDMTNIKVIVEKHSDGYVAYPLGLKGVVVGEGNTYEEALSDVRSAIRFHVETFGDEVLLADPPVLEVFVAEAGVAI